MPPSGAKISEMPFHLQSSPFGAPLRTRSTLPFALLRSRFRFLFCPSGSLRVAEQGGGGGRPDARRNAGPRTRRYPWDEDYSESAGGAGEGGESRRNRPSRAPQAPWLQRWSDPSPPAAESQPHLGRRKKKEEEEGGGVGYLDRSDGGRGSIERIVYRLRNLGLDKEKDEEDADEDSDLEMDDDMRLGDLLERSWNRPDSLVLGEDATVLPWEREGTDGLEFADDRARTPEKRVRAPTMAELTIEDSELRRLRRLGIPLRERITIPKAGVTQAILEKIHDAWRKSELVRLKFHETLAHDMKTAHEIVEVSKIDWLPFSNMTSNSSLKRFHNHCVTDDCEKVIELKQNWEELLPCRLPFLELFNITGLSLAALYLLLDF